jgi:FkbM family methyltransferase
VKIDRTYVLRSGLAKGLKKRGGLGLRQALRLGDGLSPEDAFLQSLSFAGHTIFDIGGFVGIHTIFFASRAGPEGRVVTFEPDPVNYQNILVNVAVNELTNVVVRNVGVGERPGRLEFVYPSDRGRGSAHPESLEHYRRDPSAQRATLPVTSIDAELRSSLAGTPAPDFVKIDVEGLEFAVLEGMAETVRQTKPAIFVEIHGRGLEAKGANGRRVVEWLHGHGYNILHVESGQTITPDSPGAAREGHLYGS